MDWKHSLKSNVTTAEELAAYLPLTRTQTEQMNAILTRFPMTAPQYYLSLIRWDDPEDPIRRMCIPAPEENDMTGTFDSSGESTNTVLPGLQHKYSQTALILSTHRCAMYCRHCFRKRLVGISDDETAENINEMAAYIRSHPEISNVLISGGDAFLNSNVTIEHYLELFSDIEHLDLIRFGTRTPVVLPSRIYHDPELLTLLKSYARKKTIYVVTQFNHPNELTTESQKAIQALLDAGIIIKNQTVLLKGVNGNSHTLGRLFKGLTRIGIVPYYLFQCRPVSGVGNHFQVPLRQGYQIVEEAKQMQNGQGKCIRYVMSHVSGKIEILGEAGSGDMLFKYHQAKSPQDQSRIFSKLISDEQSWLDF
ncbi:MAG: KamA family radical SAM protein [Lachnospiraceae bacterium]